MTRNIRTDSSPGRVLLALLVCAMSFIAAPVQASSAPLAGEDAHLTLTVIPPTESPIRITPQSGSQVTLAITNSGMGPSGEATLSEFIQQQLASWPDNTTTGGYAMVDDSYTTDWQVWNAAGAWVQNCDADSCVIPPIPAGETWTVTANFYFRSAPLMWMIYQPLGITEAAQSGQLSEFWFTLEPPNDAACVECTAITPAVIGDFALFNTKWTSPEGGGTGSPTYVANPGTQQTFNLDITNSGTAPAGWGGQVSFSSSGMDWQGWPVGVDTINGLRRSDLPRSWGTTSVPGTPCNIEGTSVSPTMVCSGAGPIAPGATLTIPFKFVYENPPPPTEEVGQNFKGSILAEVWSASSSDASNCGYGDSPMNADCIADASYVVAADAFIEALGITAAPGRVAADGWTDTIDWTITYRNGGKVATLEPARNEIFIPISTGHEFLAGPADWNCAPVSSDYGADVYAVVRCVPEGERSLAPQSQETLTVVTTTTDPRASEVWMGAWDWRARVDYNPEGGNVRSECANPYHPTFARISPTALPDNLAPCGIYAAFPLDITPPADLTIVKSSSAPAVRPGESFIWTIKVTNGGAGDATDVRVSDTLPEGTTASAAPTGCVLAGVTVTCDVAVLPAGGTLTFPVTVTADDPVPASVLESGELVNTATVTADNSNCPVTEPCDATSIVQVAVPSTPPTSTLPPSTPPTTQVTSPPATVPPREVLPPVEVLVPPVGGPLPRTGAPVVVQVMGGLAAGMIGVALLFASRRSRRECDS